MKNVRAMVPVLVATVAVCGYIKYQRTELEIARFDYSMRVFQEEKRALEGVWDICCQVR